MNTISRRRFISFSSISAALLVIPINLKAIQKKISWVGFVLGANANMTLYHENTDYARTILQECVKEIDRLEKIFSLFQRDSSIVQLNKKGFLNNPPKEFVELLTFSKKISELTDGFFDITVQPLWILHAKHFSKESNKDITIPAQKIKEVKKNIGWEKLVIDKTKVYFKQENMAITLNGIAQGYITDKITQILEEKGFKNVLIDLGEIRALGKNPDKNSWTVALFDKKNFLKLNNNAIASSGAYGTQFNKNYHHLFNPKSGTSANYVKNVTVIAPTATLADALSTSLAVMPKEKSKNLLNLFPDVIAIIS